MPPARPEDQRPLRRAGSERVFALKGNEAPRRWRVSRRRCCTSAVSEPRCAWCRASPHPARPGTGTGASSRRSGGGDDSRRTRSEVAARLPLFVPGEQGDRVGLLASEAPAWYPLLGGCDCRARRCPVTLALRSKRRHRGGSDGGRPCAGSVQLLHDSVRERSGTAARSAHIPRWQLRDARVFGLRALHPRRRQGAPELRRRIDAEVLHEIVACTAAFVDGLRLAT